MFVDIATMTADELEVSEHALGRLIERAPLATYPAATQIAAHRAVRRLRESDVSPCFADRNAPFLPPAGPGVFVCTLQVGHDKSIGQDHAHVRARTGLDRDQLDERQEQQSIVTDNGSDELRLGDALLLPVPLRRLIECEDGDGVQVKPWGRRHAEAAMSYTAMQHLLDL